MIFVNFNFHVNMWYAEYTDEQVLRWFPNLYRGLLEFMWENPDVKAGWDIESSRTIPFLERVAPDVLDGLREGVKKGQFEIILDTWSFSLASMHTWEEFALQHDMAVKELKRVFGRVSSGYFAQEGAYHPFLPSMLKRLGVEFLLLSYLQVGEFDRRLARDLRVHLVKGEDGTELPFVMHVSSLLDPVDVVKKGAELGGGLTVLDDAEIANPSRLTLIVESLRGMENVKFALASEIVEKSPRGIPVSILDSTWALGVYDHGMWLRDPWDQHLWTLNEVARREIAKAEWWLRRARKAGLNVDVEEREIHEAKRWLLLGQNSDKFGWNPRAEKRIQGEYELRLASELAQVASTVLSEKTLKFDRPTEGVRQIILYNFHAFPVPPSPLRIDVEFDSGILKPDEVSATLDGKQVGCDLLTARLFPDGAIKSGTITVIGSLGAEETSTLTLKRSSTPSGRTDLHVSDSELSNSLIRVRLEGGLPASITDLKTGATYGGEPPLITQRLKLEGDKQEEEVKVEVTNRGERGVYVEVTSTVKQSAHSLIVNKYRVYSGLPLLEAETRISIFGKFPGSAEPLVLNLPRPRTIWRELGGNLSKVRMEKGRQRLLLVNDWAAVYSGEVGLLVAADCCTRAMKDVKDAKNEVSFFTTETTFKDNQFEHLSGEWTTRAAIIPLRGEPTSEDLKRAKVYNYGVGTIPLIHFDKPRLS
ncbi:MAG: hypothetical protein QXN15_11720 [Candidatus Jordarchaeales archaeon]|nr:hypothetical protein [Candidatus Jordarchaeia archaeon]